MSNFTTSASRIAAAFSAAAITVTLLVTTYAVPLATTPANAIATVLA